jgi:ferredoxin
MLELHVLRDRDGDSAGCGEITLETGENLIERAKAASEQAMRVPILRCAGSGCDRCGRPVALQDVDPLEVLSQGAGRRQPADPRADNHCPLTQLARTAAISRRW